jgi:hypothetical protein
MIKVGDKEQIFSASFIAQDNEETLVDVPAGEGKLTLSFMFVPGAGDARDASWRGEGDTVRFTFTGWRNSLGTCVAEPTKFADLGNRKIYFSLAQYLIGDRSNLVHVFVYLGAPNV